MKKRHDYYYKKAKAENYAARSVYKLEEAQKKFSFIHSNDLILDVGCTPGSWSKYLLDKILKGGYIVGVDIIFCSFSHPRFKFMKTDIFNTPAESLRPDRYFDTVISDAMPNTTQDKETNHYQSISLGESVFALLPSLLRSGGNFFIKLYDGGDFPNFKKKLKDCFEEVKIFKPKSSRDESREIFLFARGFTASEEGA